MRDVFQWNSPQRRNGLDGRGVVRKTEVTVTIIAAVIGELPDKGSMERREGGRMDHGRREDSGEQ